MQSKAQLQTRINQLESRISELEKLRTAERKIFRIINTYGLKKNLFGVDPNVLTEIESVIEYAEPTERNILLNISETVTTIIELERIKSEQIEVLK